VKLCDGQAALLGRLTNGVTVGIHENAHLLNGIAEAIRDGRHLLRPYASGRRRVEDEADGPGTEFDGEHGVFTTRDAAYFYSGLTQFH
jgi:hypothetical protein